MGILYCTESIMVAPEFEVVGGARARVIVCL